MENNDEAKIKLSPKWYNVLQIYMELGKSLYTYLKTNNTINTDCYEDPDIISLEATKILKKYLSKFEDCNNLHLIVVCSFVFANKLHNDDSHYISYKEVRNVFGYNISLKRSEIIDIEMNMCSIVKYIVK